MLEPTDKWLCELVEPRHPALHKPADIDPFTAPDDANWAQREVDMFQLMHKRHGIGLASPQIGNSYNMFVLYIHVTRPEKVKVSYTLYDGKTEVEGWLEGMDSRCFQHEFEHLQGKLFLDNVSELKLQRAMKKRDKYLKEIQRKVRV